jgi:hypothetical protein
LKCIRSSLGGKKLNKRLMAITIKGETKREGKRKAKRPTTCGTQRKGHR